MTQITFDQGFGLKGDEKVVLTGRRALLAHGIALFVATVIQGKVLARDIPQVEVEPEFVEGVTKAEIGQDLIALSDEELEQMDPERPTVGRTRKLAEKALGKVSQILSKIRK